VLNKYLLSLFGVDDFKELQEKLKMHPLTLIAMEEAIL
jgi:hypothetical protein